MYNGYNEKFFQNEEKSAQKTSAIVFPYILERIRPKSVVDFGCGTGEWLGVAKKSVYVKKVVGIDGEYAKKNTILDEHEFIAWDLNTEIQLGEKYDLAVSLEVVEHLKQTSEEIFVGNLVRHADIILFSAAIPYQGGKYHINEQYPTYWERMFNKFGYVMCDCVRNVFWDMIGVDVWYKQNMFLVCKSGMEQEIMEKFYSDNHIKDIVHPEYWEYYRNLQYIFPFSCVEKGEKIVVYGAGDVGRAYISQINKTRYAQIVCWCDGASEYYRSEKLEVDRPEKLKELEFDKVIVAVKQRDTFDEIAQNLICGGVAEEKLIWESPVIFS